MIGLALFLIALVIVAYALRTAYVEWDSTWIDVLHKYDGRPTPEGAHYVVTCSTRKQARKVMREARKEPRITDLHKRVCPPEWVENFLHEIACAGCTTC